MLSLAFMNMGLLFKGILLGFSIAAPVGPIGILCIRRTLAEGRLSGLVSGLGAATADMFYGSIAGFGLAAVSVFLVRMESLLALVGGVYLVYMGVRTFASKPAENAAQSRVTGLWGAYASTLFLTLTNPLTILSFVAVFAGMGIASSAGSYLEAGLLVLGVFLGSAAWWLLLSGGVSLLRERVGAHLLVWVNRVSGAILAGFGIFAIWRGVVL